MACKTFHLDIPVRFEHVDVAGIVFYPRYIEMLNRVIEEWFGASLQCNFSQLHFERRLGIPTAHLDVSFIKPSRLDDTLRFNLRLKEIRNSAFVMEHDVVHGSERRLHVVHSLVFVSLDNLKPVRIPDDFRAKMLGYLVPEHPPDGG